MVSILGRGPSSKFSGNLFSIFCAVLLTNQLINKWQTPNLCGGRNKKVKIRYELRYFKVAINSNAKAQLNPVLIKLTSAAFQNNQNSKMYALLLEKVQQNADISLESNSIYHDFMREQLSGSHDNGSTHGKGGRVYLTTIVFIYNVRSDIVHQEHFEVRS